MKKKNILAVIYLGLFLIFIGQVCAQNCIEYWKCGDWSKCTGGLQQRSCIDIDNCGTFVNKPTESFSCEIHPNTILRYPNITNLRIPSDYGLDFEITAISNSKLAETSQLEAEWFVDGMKVNAEKREGYRDELKTGLFLTGVIKNIRVLINDGYSTNSITWQIENVENLNCTEDWVCDWSTCTSEGFVYPLSCIDRNNCLTTYNYPKQELCGLREERRLDYSIWDCGIWSDCVEDYSIKNLAENTINIFGRQTRVCKNINDKLLSELETRRCSLEIPVDLRSVDWCNSSAIEIYNKETNQFIGRLTESDSGEEHAVNINFAISNFTGYCDSCYNGIKDGDEEKLDCGGKCLPCTSINRFNFDLLKVIEYFILILILAAVAYLIFFNREKPRKHKRKKL